MGLLDVLQSASNAVAGNVAGPVDILSLLLRKGGIPIPDEPLGGSEWMKRKGLMRDVPMGAERIAGETIGLLAPTAIAAKAPQIARGLLKAQENAAAPRTLSPEAGVIVYHGSPHKFDKFDASKIGTGEGAQAYGHGSYLAENPKVADAYRYVHGGGAPTIDSVSIGDKVISGLSMSSRHGLGLTPSRVSAEIPGVTKEQARALAILGAAQGDAKQALSIAANRGDLKLYAAMEEMAPKFKVLEMAGPDTYLYKADLPDEFLPKMLDWDKPLRGQSSATQRSLERALPKGLLAHVAKEDPKGYALHELLMRHNSGKFDLNADESGKLTSIVSQRVAEKLREAGIPGIRYLDGGSRSAGQGTYNYVVFPGLEDQIKILERNGVPLGLLGR